MHGVAIVLHNIMQSTHKHEINKSKHDIVATGLPVLAGHCMQKVCLCLHLPCMCTASLCAPAPLGKTHCKKCGVTEHPKGAIFYCFHGNSMGYHGNSKILLPWGVQLHRVFYSAVSYALLLVSIAESGLV